MDGPWSKYPAAASTPDGPWARYATPQDAPASVQSGSALMEVPRQIGLAARYGMEGLAQTAEIFTEPIRQLVVNPIARMLQPRGLGDTVTGSQPVQGRPLSQEASRLADRLGLPSPQTADERVVGDATRLVAGAGAMAGGAQALARGAAGATQAALQGLATAPGQQLASAAGAGLAGGAVRETGGGEGMQLAAGVLGGVGAGVAAPLAQAAAGKVAQVGRGTLERVLTPQKVEIVLRAELAKQGIKWEDIGAPVKQQLIEDARAAVFSGQPLNGAALERLVDFRRIGAQPLVGDLTQDPRQLTQQRNLAKQLANQGGGPVMGGDLPSIQNENARKVLGTIDRQSRSPLDGTATGQRIIDGVQMADDTRKAGVDRLYSQARDSAGRSIELDGYAFTSRANALLKEALAPKLGAEVDAALNDIALGRTPLTVEYAEQLKTMLARKQRAAQGTQGDLAYAYGLVRQALEDAAPRSGPTNPGNLPAVPGTLPPRTGDVGQQAIDAFGAARSAAKERFAWQKSAPFIEDALGGAAPDQFVKRHVINAPVRDLTSLRDQLGNDRETIDGVRRQLLDYILQRGSADIEHTMFSSAGMKRALDQIGDAKLALFFQPDEIADIKAAIAVGRHMQAQPIGSAVNNSNTAGMVLGRLNDLLGKLGSVPVVGPMVADPLQSLTLRAQAVPLRDLSRGLVQSPDGPRLSDLLRRGAAAGTGYGTLQTLSPDERNRQP